MGGYKVYGKFFENIFEEICKNVKKKNAFSVVTESLLLIGFNRYIKFQWLFDFV